MHSLYLMFILLTFTCIGCVHNVGVQDVFTNHQGKYLHNENENYAALIPKVNNGVYKRDIFSNEETHKPVVKKDNNMLNSNKQLPTDPKLIEASVVQNHGDNNKTSTNRTEPIDGTIKVDDSLKSFNSAGATKRGAVVFGGLTLCALLYLTFKLYRNKQTKSEVGITFQGTESKFGYGVLKSDDNMELSNLPLNMESDDEEDDLQLFDLEQSKRSMSTSNTRILSYENDGKSDIEVLDLDLPLPEDSSRSNDRSHLLLDIDDGMTDPLLSLQSSTTKT